MALGKKTRPRPILTDGPIGRQLVLLALPMVAGILAMFAFNAVDTYYVGRLGTIPLAAMALTFPVVMVVTSISLGLSVSTSIAVAQTVGQGDQEAERRLTTDALLLSIAVGLLLMVGGYLTVDRLLLLLGASDAARPLAALYLRIWFLGVPLLVLEMTGNMAVRATGDTLTTGLVLVGGMLFNAVLDPVLIFGLGPLLPMGIAGAAIATVVARTVTLAVVFFLLVRNGMLGGLPRQWSEVMGSWLRIVRNGVPIALNNLITPFTMGVVTWMVARMSEAAVAGYGVAGRVESLLLTAIFSLQSVVGIFVAQNSGAGKWDRVIRCMWLCAGFSVVWGLGVFALLAVGGRWIAARFNADPLVVETAYWYFVVVGVSLGLRGVYLSLSAVLNSLDHASWATGITVLKGVLITVPVAWYAGLRYGVPGVFAGVAAGHAVAAGVTFVLSRLVVARVKRAAARQ